MTFRDDSIHPESGLPRARYRKKLILIALVLVFVAGGAFWFAKPAAPNAVEPSKFQTLPLHIGVLRETVSGTGFVQPDESVVVCAEVAGRVIQVLKDHGDEVKEGEELLVLDDEAARLTLKRAEAARATASRRAESGRGGRREGQEHRRGSPDGAG
jgi:multidrug efflux pump subunit AcrA (membrane-fusion protein)